MALDPHGTWIPECGLDGCTVDRAPDGIVDVMVLVGDQIRTAKVHVCAPHRDRLLRPLLTAAA